MKSLFDRMRRNQGGSIAIMIALVVGVGITMIGAGAGTATRALQDTTQQETARGIANDGLRFSAESTLALIKTGVIAQNPATGAWFQNGALPPNVTVTSGSGSTAISVGYTVCDPSLMTTTQQVQLFTHGMIPSGSGCVASNQGSAPQVKIASGAAAATLAFKLRDESTPTTRTPAGAAVRRVSVAQNSNAASPNPPDCNLSFVYGDYYIGQTATLTHVQSFGTPSAMKGPAFQFNVTGPGAPGTTFTGSDVLTTAVPITFPSAIPATGPNLQYNEVILGTGTAPANVNLPVCAAGVKLWTPPSCSVNVSQTTVQVGTPFQYSVNVAGDFNGLSLNVNGSPVPAIIAPTAGILAYGIPGSYTFNGNISLNAPLKPTGPASSYNCPPVTVTVTAAPVITTTISPTITVTPSPSPSPGVQECLVYLTYCGGSAASGDCVDRFPSDMWVTVPANYKLTNNTCNNNPGGSCPANGDGGQHVECCPYNNRKTQIPAGSGIKPFQNAPDNASYFRGKLRNFKFNASNSTYVDPVYGVSYEIGTYILPKKTDFLKTYGSTAVNANAQLFGSQGCQLVSAAASPLIIDFSNHGIKLAPAVEGMMFDIFGTGRPMRIGWPTEPETALWISLPTKDNQIDSVNQLFGNNTVGPDGKKALTGFEALGKYDANHDGFIDKNDPIFSKLRLWSDLNEDGKVQPGELFTLPEKGVESIDLRYINYNEKLNFTGDATEQRSVINMTDGTFRAVFDVWFVPDQNR